MEPLAVEFEEKQYGRDGAKGLPPGTVSWGLYCVKTAGSHRHTLQLIEVHQASQAQAQAVQNKTMAACNQTRVAGHQRFG